MSRSRNAHPLIDQAAEQAAALVDQVTPHVEAARDVAEQAISAAASKARRPKRKRRGRTLLTLTALVGVGALVGQRLRSRSSAAPYPSPAPATEPDLDREDLNRLEDEAPLHLPDPPADSPNGFFDEMVSETAKGSRRS